MSLIRWQPLREVDTLRKQMDHLFDDLLSGDLAELTNKGKTWAPAVELQETDTNLVLKAEIPGMEAKDLDVEVTPESVSISGEHQEEAKTEKKGYFRSEFHYGQFQRIVPLPVTVQHDQVKAEFKQGVLTLTLPKVQVVEPKTFKVKLNG